MSELVHSGFGNGTPARMTSREIADLVGSRHDKVRQSIERLVDRGTIAQPPMGDVQEKGGNNRTYTTTEYVFEGEQGKRDSYVVVAQLSPEFTARLVDRWQELEQAKTVPAHILPQTYAEALRALADESEAKQALLAKVEQDAPKVAFANQVEVAPDAITLSQAAKVFDTGRTRFCQWMREIKWLTRTNEPYQDKINAGLLDVKLGSWDHPEKGLQRSVTALVTGKGLAKLHKLRGSTAH